MSWVDRAGQGRAERHLRKASAPGKTPGSQPSCQVSILLYVWEEHHIWGCSAMIQKQSKQVVYRLLERPKTNLAPINISLLQKWPLPVNGPAAVALIHKLVMMTVHFCFHDTAAAVADTKLHIRRHMFGESGTANQRGCCDAAMWM